MTSTDDPRHTRPLGRIERYSSIRHTLDQYFAVIIGAVVTAAADGTNTQASRAPLTRPQLYGALRTVVAAHPAPLALTLQHTEDPAAAHAFAMAREVDLAQHIVYTHGAEADDNAEALKECAVEISKLDEDEALRAVLERRLSTRFVDVDSVPPWQLLVTPVRVAGEDQYATQLAFAYHHALGDGTTGRLLVEALANALNKTLSAPSSETVVEIPATAGVHPSLEEVSKLPESWWNVGKVVLQDMGWLSAPNKNAWTGSRVLRTFAGKAADEKEIVAFAEYRTRVSVVRVSAAQLARLTTESRARGTSVTAALVALGAAALYRALKACFPAPELAAFSTLSCSVPRNLRPALPKASGVSADTMGVFVCGIDVVVPVAGLAQEHTTDGIWAAANLAKASIAREVAKGMRDTDSGMLKFVDPLHEYFTSKPGKTRAASFEVSSLVAPQVSSQGPYALTHPLFVQSASAMGAAVSLGAMSFKGGDMSVGATWTAGGVQHDGIVPAFTTQFATLLASITKT